MKKFEGLSIPETSVHEDTAWEIIMTDYCDNVIHECNTIDCKGCLFQDLAKFKKWYKLQNK